MMCNQKKMESDPAYDQFDSEPCVPDDDDDGSSRLDCFLRQYNRINRAYACRQSTTKIPAVWVHTNNFWVPLSSDAVATMIRTASPDGSLCRALMANLFKLNRPLRDVTEHAFAHDDSPQLVGLYEHKLNKGQFAIAVDLKKQKISELRVAAGFLAGIQASILGGKMMFGGR